MTSFTSTTRRIGIVRIVTSRAIGTGGLTIRTHFSSAALDTFLEIRARVCPFTSGASFAICLGGFVLVVPRFAFIAGNFSFGGGHKSPRGAVGTDRLVGQRIGFSWFAW